MSVLRSLNKYLFKSTPTFAIAVMGGTFFFERTFDILSESLFESINKGKLWKDVEASLPAAEE